MNNKGFTLIELLIAMAMATVVGMAGIALFTSTNRAYKANEDVAEAQQNVRIAAERLAKDIRMAGFGLPDPPFTVTFASGLSLTSPITLTDGGTGGPDSITVLGGGYLAGSLVGSLDTPAMNRSGATFLCYSPSGSDSFFNPADGTSNQPPYSNRKNISLNGTTYTTLLANEVKGTSCTSGVQLTLGSLGTLDKDYGDGTPLFIIQAITYSINTALTGCTATNPCLASADYTQLRGGNNPTDPQVVAEGIEDIQFAYGIDSSPRDGKLDYVSPYAANAFQDSPADPTSIIAVRAGIVAKAKTQAQNAGKNFTRPALENRLASTPADAYRRRVLQKIIKIRNPRQGA